MSFIDYAKDKKILFTCDTDLDGTGCRILAHYYLEQVAELFEFVQAQTGDLEHIKEHINNQTLGTYDLLIFCDVSIPSDYITYYSKQFGCEIFLFDHHKTTRDNLVKWPGYVYDIDKCSAQIFYDSICTKRKYYNPSVEKFVSLVNDYDLWKEYSDNWLDAKNLNRLLWYYNRNLRVRKKDDQYKDFVEYQLRKFNNNENFFFYPREETIIKKEQKEEEEEYSKVIKNAEQRVDSEGNLYVYYEASRRISDLSSRYLRENLNIKYAVTYCTFIKKERKISLRSRGFDVKAIAEKYGGGGHKCAAGFRAETDEFIEELKEGKRHLL